MSILPPQVPGPVPGQGGHFAHHDWLTASVVALDQEIAPTGFITAIASVITMEPNWTCESAMACRSGRWVEVALTVTYSGPAISVPADGNIANQTVGTLAPPWRPPSTRGMGAAAGTGSTGRLSAFSCNTSGAVQLSATTSGGNINSGASWSFSGVWAVA